MILTDKILPASLGGVPFLWQSVSTTQGRKTIVHEYPGSDNRFVEDQGGTKKVYSVNALVSGEDFLQRKKSFERKLNTEGVQELGHPYDGVIKGVVTGGYTVSESETAVGEVRFTFNFSVTNNTLPQPAVIVSSSQEVAELSQLSIDSLEKKHSGQI